MNDWHCPRLYEGQTVVIIAGGPSLTREQIARVQGRAPLIGINDAYRIAPLDVLYAADRRWWQHHQGVPDFHGLKVTQDEATAITFPDVRRLRLTGEHGLERDPGGLRSGGNGGYQAINLAYHLGARRIVLLGYDMRLIGRRRHWFGDHPGRMNQDSCYPEWVRRFRTLAPELAADGIEVINCTPGSALDAWPIAAIEDVFA